MGRMFKIYSSQSFIKSFSNNFFFKLITHQYLTNKMS